MDVLNFLVGTVQQIALENNIPLWFKMLRQGLLTMQEHLCPHEFIWHVMIHFKAILSHYDYFFLLIGGIRV